jgi:hypothetical protein
MDCLTACLFGEDGRKGREEDDDTVLWAPVVKAILERQRNHEIRDPRGLSGPVHAPSPLYTLNKVLH